MSNKKHNHYVPKAYLKGWETLDGKQLGSKSFSVLDLKSQKIRVPDKKRLFASIEYLYSINNEVGIDQHYENFFCDGESYFGQVLASLSRGSIPSLDGKGWYYFIESIVSMGLRDPRLINSSLEAFSKALKLPIDNYLKDIVLDILCKQIQSTVYKFSDFPISIFKLASHNLITCEVPFWDMSTSKFKKNCGMIPLSSNYLLVIGDEFDFIKDINLDQKVLNIVDISTDNEKTTILTAMVNNFILARARKWVVFSNKIDLKTRAHILDELKYEKVLARKLSDKFCVVVGDERILISD